MIESRKGAMLRYVQLRRATGWVYPMALLLVCAAGAAAQETARVVELTGQVSILKDSTPVALFVGSSISPKQIVITGSDGYARFQLADGSVFEVFPKARVTFRSSYSWTDLVQVWLGRIRVQIDHRNGPNHKSVSTPTALISVRGTVFDVVVEDDDDTTLVSVEEGLVDVQHLLQAGRAVRLATGDSVRVYRDQPLARVIDKTPAVRTVLNATREALYQVLVRRGASGAGSSGGASTPTQGDKGKDTGGGTPSAPGAPPTAPGPPPVQ
jgi:hypothetical protein